VIGRMHAQGVIHRDLKPANILVGAASGGVRLTGFGIASRLPRERQAPGPPEAIAGTLAYMAPEQSGRMNRSVDSRSDLYACGVTLYEMLTGVLPFSAADPMEWIHCHIARQPAQPRARARSRLPPSPASGDRKGDEHQFGERRHSPGQRRRVGLAPLPIRRSSQPPPLRVALAS
jgi:serine/threonine protein kinase